MTGVRGDEDVLEAHIDACLADQARRAEEHIRALEERREYDGMDTTEGVGHVGDVTGVGKYDSILMETNEVRNQVLVFILETLTIKT